MKQYLIIIALLGALVLPGMTKAEDGTSDDSSLYPMPPVYNDDSKEKRQNALEEFRAKRDATQETIREKRDAFFEEAKEKRDEIQEARKEMVGNTKESRSALEAEIKAKREALRAEIQEIKKERVSARKAFVENRFNQVIVVLTSAQERIAAKITELEGKGYDMTNAKTHLDESKTSLDEAKALLETLKSTVVSDTDETSAVKPRETAKKIEELLKETRMHLVEAIKAMKESVNPDDEDDSDDTEEETSDDDSSEDDQN